MTQRLLTRLVLLGLISFSNPGFASAFQLFEANGAGTGDFYAGGAAIAEDASTAFFNPAGLVRLSSPQIVISDVNIFSRINFKGADKWSSASPIFAGLSYPLSGTAQGDKNSFIPSFDFAIPINHKFYFGFSASVPFGLSTDYGKESFLRYSATKTSLQVMDLSPSIGFKVTDQFSLGIGLDADYLDAEFDSIAGLPVLSGLWDIPLNAYDTQSKNKASGWGYGFHAGALYQFTPETRVGLAYRSKVSFSANGTSRFQGNLAGGPSNVQPDYHPVPTELSNPHFSSDATLPASTMLSVYHQLEPAWAVMGTVTYTEWKVFDQITLKNVASIDANLQPESITVIVPERFRNTWRASAGIHYQPNQTWLLRAGVGYDQTPTVNHKRNVRLPDGNRTALALGAHYQASKTLGLDAGWTHLFFQKGAVDVAQYLGDQQTVTQGKARSSADLVGLQLTWNIL